VLDAQFLTGGCLGFLCRDGKSWVPSPKIKLGTQLFEFVGKAARINRCFNLILSTSNFPKGGQRSAPLKKKKRFGSFEKRFTQNWAPSDFSVSSKNRELRADLVLILKDLVKTPNPTFSGILVGPPQGG
jgi:hypothetical protein